MTIGKSNHRVYSHIRRVSQPARGGEWGVSVARYPPDRAYLLGSEGHTSVVVGTCKNSPMTVVPCRVKT